MKLLRRTLFVLFLIFWVVVLVVYGNYLTIPRHNTPATHFDTIVVLGTPSRMDGTPSPEQRERVPEGFESTRPGWHLTSS